MDTQLLDSILDMKIGSNLGRKSKEARFDYLRDLEVSDAEEIFNRTPAPIAPRKSMRHTHHQVARLTADGVKPAEISAITGYAGSTLSILKNDPAFQELVSYYESQKKEVYLDVHQRLANLGTDAIEVLQERLGEQPEVFTNKELMSLVETTMDRSVAPAKGGPKAPQSGVAAPVAITIQFQQSSTTPPHLEGTLPILDLQPAPPEGDAP